MKRIALFICVSIAAGSLSACGKTTVASETTAMVSVEIELSDDITRLPDGLNFGSETVAFLYRDEITDEFYASEADGDVVNDAIYNSFLTVEQKLNVNIDVVIKAGQNGSDRNTYMDHILSTVMAGEDVYDWVDLMIGNSPVMLQNGIFLDLLKNKYIDFDRPRYISGLREYATVYNKLFFTSGDASLGYLQDMFCIMFNKQIAEDYSLGNLYDIVESGNWTIDKLIELSTAVYKDINGNGITDAEDNIGFWMYDQNHLSGFLASTESKMFTKDDSGNWNFTYGSERDVNVVDKLSQLLMKTDGSTLQHGSDLSKFVNGNVLFISAQFDDASTKLREMKGAYGILPYPKYEKSQTGYYSNSRSTHNAFSMPVTCGDPDMAGAVLELLSATNYNTVVPAYYEIALKTKYVRDDESARVYDLILSGMTFDFSYIFSNVATNPVTNIYINAIKDGDFASKLATHKESISTALSEYMKKVYELE